MAQNTLKRLTSKFYVFVKPVCATEIRTVKTAGVIVIGDEILKGAVRDTNSIYMTMRLHKIGVKVKKICVIGDSVQEICDEVKGFSGAYNYVITSGGIGPTHDDLTFEGVAKAFDEQLYCNSELKVICEKFYKTTDISSPGMKLAHIPKSAVLTYGIDKTKGIASKYPNISVKNVYMFPGIPELLEKSFDLLCETVFLSQSRFYTKHIYLNLKEHQIAQTLDALIKEFPQISVGSYPKLGHAYYKVKITIESIDQQQTMNAYNKLLQMVPVGAIVNYHEK